MASAIVHPMSFPVRPVSARVVSVGSGIAGRLVRGGGDTIVRLHG